MPGPFPATALFALLTLAAAVGQDPARPAPATAPETRAADPGPLDGREKSLVVVGYSTSYAWPAMLQAMLDEHAGGARVYHVLNAVVGGAAVERWIGEPGTRNYDPTFGAMLSDFFGPDARLRGDAPEPTIAICQQSLQFTRTQRGPIAAVDDAEGMRIGTDALETLAMALHEQGLVEVHIAMHIYKRPVEPEVGNERFALKSLLTRGHSFVHEGPDVWSTTLSRFPECFDEDGVHPNELGMKMMAEGWYRALAGDAARQDIVDRMYEREYDVRTMMREYIAWRRGES